MVSMGAILPDPGARRPCAGQVAGGQFRTGARDRLSGGLAERRFQLGLNLPDDPLGAAPIHLVNGAVELVPFLGCQDTYERGAESQSRRFSPQSGDGTAGESCSGAFSGHRGDHADLPSLPT